MAKRPSKFYLKWIAIIITIGVPVVKKIIDSDSLWYTIADTAFYVSMSGIIIDLSLAFDKLKELIDMDISKNDTSMKSLDTQLKEIVTDLTRDDVYFPFDTRPEDKIIECIREGGINRIRVICYGTGKFGNILQIVEDDYPNIKREVVVCAPENNLLKSERDKNSLQAVIRELRTMKKTTVYTSSIPPTIRAAILYDSENKPVLCSYQTYYFYNTSHNKIAKGADTTPCIIANQNQHIFIQLVNVVEKEFTRLKNSDNVQ